MIPKRELDKAINIAKEFGIGKLYLFESSLYKSPARANDYDFAVAAIALENVIADGISEWSEQRDLNPRPPGPEPGALPN